MFFEPTELNMWPSRGHIWSRARADIELLFFNGGHVVNFNADKKLNQSSRSAFIKQQTHVDLYRLWRVGVATPTPQWQARGERLESRLKKCRASRRLQGIQ